MMGKNGKPAYEYEAEILDEWDEDTISELIPMIDVHRELASKNQEIAKLKEEIQSKDKELENKERVLKTVTLSIHDSVTKKRKIYLTDILMFILVLILAYVNLAK